MDNVLNSKKSWLAAPALFLLGVAAIIAVWLTHSPEWVQAHFDADGASPVESATIGLFYMVIGLLWLVPAMRCPKARRFWRWDFSLVTMLAICRELDWHKSWIDTSNVRYVAGKLAGKAFTGTAYKLKFLTRTDAPWTDKLIVVAFFAVFIGVLGGTILYFLPRLWRGLWKLHPVSWSIGFLGGVGVLVNVTDRFPSVLRKMGVRLTDSVEALQTAMEEGLELLLPLMAILAILQAYFIYVAPGESHDETAAWREI